MKKRTAGVWSRAWALKIMSIVVVVLSAGLSSAETEHHGMDSTSKMEPHAPKVSLSTRTMLDLPPAAREGLKLTMREHLEAIEAIVSALARDDFARATKLAHEELGFSKHHVAMQREEGATFPPAYHELAMAHHQAAEALAEVMPAKDFQQILSRLEQAIHACVECHQAFRLSN